MCSCASLPSRNWTTTTVGTSTRRPVGATPGSIQSSEGRIRVPEHEFVAHVLFPEVAQLVWLPRHAGDAGKARARLFARGEPSQAFGSTGAEKAASDAGRSTVTVVPVPASLLTARRPPNASTIVLVIHRPRPN